MELIPTRTMKRSAFLLLAAATISWQSLGQVRTLSMDEVIQTALTQNPGLKAVASETRSQEKLKQTSVDLPKTQVMLMSGQYNSLNNDNNLTITQAIPFPTVFASQSKLYELRIESSRYREATTLNELLYQIKQVCQTLHYLHARGVLLKQQDSLYADLVRITTLQQATGEGTLLQRTSAETRYNDVKNQYRQNVADRLTYRAQLKVLLSTSEEVDLVPEPFVPLTTTLLDDTSQVSGNPLLAYHRSLSSIARQEKRVESNRALPDLSVGYFNQTLIGFQQQTNGTDRYFSSSDRFSGFMVGVALPIWFVPAHARVRAAEARSEAASFQTKYMEQQLHGEWNKAIQQFEKHRNSLNYYTASALPNANLLLRQSTLAYRAGDISQADYRLNLQQAISIQEAYTQTVLQYNLSILTLEFLSGQYAKQ